jgi:hypothetical protein
VWGERNSLQAPVAFEPIFPRWHESIDFGEGEEKTGKPITLNIRNINNDEAKLPYEHLFWLRHKTIGSGNWYGVPFYRAMYSAWWRAINLLNWEMIQAEHLSGGTFSIEAPENTTVSLNDTTAIGNVLGRMRNGEASWVQVPPGWQVKVLDIGGGVYSLTDQIKTANEQIMFAGFGQVMLIGLGEVGAKASSETHLKMHYNGIKGIANELSAQFTRQVTHKIVLQNWGQEAANNLTPILRFENLSPDNLVERAEAIVSGVTSGVLSANDTIENVYRDMIGVKPLEGKSSRKPLEAKQPLFEAGKAIETPYQLVSACEHEEEYNYTFDSSKSGAQNALDHLIKFNSEYKLREFKRDITSAESYTDFQLSALVLDTHKITGKALILGEVEKNRKARAKDLVKALKGDLSKVGIKIPKKQVKSISSEISGITDLALGFGFNEAEREINRQIDGTLAPKEIQKERQDELAIQASAAISKNNNIVLTIPTAQRQAALARLSEELSEQMIEALETEYSAVFIAQRRKGVLLTIEEAEAILARREAVVASAVIAEMGAKAFATGRDAFFVQFENKNPQAIEGWVRSELLDSNTCEPCEDIDGQETEFKLTSAGVYPFCDSTKGAGNACRGMDIAILSDQFRGRS